MKIKNKVKGSLIFPYLVYLRYFAIRYFVERRFLPYKLFINNRMQAIGKGITFFGYYNISPTNSNGDILFLKVKNEFVRGSLNEAADIMLERRNGDVHKLAETKAWNWQQGCMLQWLPNSNDKIIYNDFDETTSSFVTKLIDFKGNLVEQFNKPVNNICKTGEYALCLNYDRLAKMRPDYGYFNRGNIKLPLNREDGIWNMDLKTGKSILIISLDQLKNLKYVSSMQGAEHKVNHIDINPIGTRFMFLHRWIGPQGRFMRLITANSDGSNLQILNGDIMTSHCCWINNEEIVSFCNYNGKVAYFKFIDKTSIAELVSDKMPLFDGHPSISPDGNYLIIDSYPDKARFSSLLLYDFKSNRMEKIGVFHQSLRYTKEMRIDLHPKWSNDGKSVFFESGHSGNRQLYNMNVIK